MGSCHLRIPPVRPPVPFLSLQHDSRLSATRPRVRYHNCRSGKVKKVQSIWRIRTMNVVTPLIVAVGGIAVAIRFNNSTEHFAAALVGWTVGWLFTLIAIAGWESSEGRRVFGRPGPDQPRWQRTEIIAGCGHHRCRCTVAGCGVGRLPDSSPQRRNELHDRSPGFPRVRDWSLQPRLVQLPEPGVLPHQPVAEDPWPNPVGSAPEFRLSGPRIADRNLSVGEAALWSTACVAAVVDDHSFPLAPPLQPDRLSLHAGCIPDGRCSAPLSHCHRPAESSCSSDAPAFSPGSPSRPTTPRGSPR